MESLQSLKILLIEDNPSDVLLLRTALEADPVSKFSLTHVERLSDALQQLEEDTFDIILVDLGLPDSSGLETFEHLHKQAPAISIVVFSGNDDEEQAIHAVRDGAQDYLVKSLSGFEMAARSIRHAIERNKLQNTLRESEKRFTTLFSSNPVPVGITRISDYAIVDVNDAWTRLTGFTKEEAIGKTSIELGLAKPETLQQIRGMLSGQDKIDQYEIPLYIRSGQERRLLISSETIQLGGEVYYLNNLLDITERKQAEESLKAEQMRFAQVAATVPGAITMLRLQPDGQVELLYASKAFDDIFGLQSANLSENAEAIIQRIPIKEVQEILKMLAGLSSALQPAYFEFHYQHPIKGEVWLENRAQPIPEADGSVIWYGVTSDITERKLADEKLRDSEARFSTIFESSPVAMGISRVRDQKITHINRSFAELYDITPEDAIGRTTDELGLWAIAEDRRKFLETLRAQNRVTGFESVARLRSGKELNVLISGELVEIEGESCFLAQIFDITERKQAEEALQESEARFSTAFFTNPAAQSILTLQTGEVIEVNDACCRLFGYSRDELIGINPGELNLWANPADKASASEELQRTGRLLPREITIRVKFGESRTIIFSAEPISWNAEPCLITSSIDITERKQTEQANHLMLDVQKKLTVIDNVFDLSRLIGGKIHELIGDGFVGISLLDESEQAMRVAGLYGLGSTAEKWIKKAGIDLTQWTYALNQMTEDELRLFRSGNLEKFEGGLYRLLLGRVPKLLCTAFEKEMKLTGAYTMGFMTHDLHLGGVTILARRDITPFMGTIEKIVSQAAIVLQQIKAQQALRKSEQHLRSLLNTQTHFIIRVDLEGHFTYWNEIYEAEFGWLYGSKLINAYDPLVAVCEHHHQRVRETVEQCVNAPGKVVKAELDKPAKDGGVRTTLWEFICLTDEHGQPSEVQCMGIEITDRKKAEEALRASEEKYRGLMESLDSVVAAVDYEGTFLYLNDTAAGQLGGTPDKLTGKTMYELFPEPIAARQLENIRKVIHEDKAMASENPSAINGSLRWQRTSIQPIHDETGRVVHVLINSTDIHDLKTAQYELMELAETLEERVKERTAEVQDLYDNAPTGYHSLDKESRIVQVNRTELSWLGYKREEFVGRSIKEFMTPDTVATFQSNFPGFVERGWVRDLEMDFICKDGSILPTVVNGIAIYDEAGNYVMSRSTVFDNSKRREAEKALRESQANLQDFLDTASDLIQSLDAEGKYVYVNNAWSDALGYSRTEAEKLSMVDVVDPEHHDLCHNALMKLLESGTPQQLEITFRTKTGEAIIVEGSFSGRTTREGHIINGIFRNITSSKQTEKALRIANIEMERALHMKDDFLTSMSHELRTPLTGILGLAEALQFNTYGDVNPRQFNALVNIENSGRHLLELINDILDISKMEAGKLELEMGTCALNEICQSSLQLVKGMAHKKHQNIAFSMNTTDIHVHGDARRLKQVLVNLLSNAVKYSPENSPIGLEVNADQDSKIVNITVWDKGIGISEEDLNKLFMPFVQLDSSLSRQQTGTGLGLALVQRLVDLHGGSIQVESTPGLGSLFTISLTIQPPSTVQTNENDILPPNIQKALIVEDNSIDSSRLTRHLRMLGIESMSHSTGNGSVEMAAEFKPDLILLDIILPDMSGWDVLEQLKQDERTRGIPVIVTSVEDDREKAHRLQAAGYLVKLFTISDLRNEIARLNDFKAPTSLQPDAGSSEVPQKGTIMLVDDNETNVFMMADFLIAQNYNVVVAYSGLEFLSRVVEVQPDIVLMDIQMPDLNGLETTQRLRSLPDPKLASVPVIAITALAMPGDRERCLEAGANEYLSKPVRLRELAEMVDDFITKDQASTP